MEKTAMRYCYTETEKAPVSIEVSIEDLRAIRDAVAAAAAADGSSYRIRRVREELVRVQRDVADQMRRAAADMAAELERGEN
jgi:hypothetical protein